MKIKAILASVYLCLFLSFYSLAQNHLIHFTGKIGHSFFNQKNMQKLIFIIAILLGIQFSLFGQWEEKNIMTNSVLTSVDFLDNETGYVVGQNKIFKTENGGDNWEEIYSASDLVFFEDIFIINDEKIIAVGKNLDLDRSEILKTEDGGSSWESIVVLSSSFLKSIHFPTPTVGFCSGSGGTILRSIDAGDTWDILNSGTGLNLQSIIFVSNLVGIAVGGSPTSSVILKTQNGGIDWVPVNSPTENNLQSVYFIDQEVGYIVGWNGEIIKTSDCGDSWSSLTSVSMFGNLEVLFTDDDTGYIVGGQANQSLIQKTNNGGELWEDVSPQITEGLVSLTFPSFDVGYAVGNNGTVVKTESGGIVTSVQNLKSVAANINFYPNPVAKEIFIESEENDVLKLIRIYNMNGVLLKEIKLNFTTTNIDFSALESGLYYLEVHSEKGNSINKIAKI